MTKRMIGVAALFAAPLLATSALAANVADTPGDAPGDKEEAMPAATPSPTDEDMPAPAAKPEESTAKDERICRRVRLDPSSRRSTKVCKTAEEWRKFNQRR